MKVAIQKWGNSLALRIPKPFAKDTGVHEGSVVEVTVVDGRLVAAPIISPTCDIEELLSRVTADNLHGEVDTGKAVGREVV